MPFLNAPPNCKKFCARKKRGRKKRRKAMSVTFFLGETDLVSFSFVDPAVFADSPVLPPSAKARVLRTFNQLLLTLPFAAAGPAGGIGLGTAGAAGLITGGGRSGGTIPSNDIAEGSVGGLMGLGLWLNLPIRPPLGRELSFATYAPVNTLLSHACICKPQLTLFVTV